MSGASTSTAIEWDEATVNASDLYWSGLEAFVERTNEGKSTLTYSSTIYLIATFAQILQDKIIKRLQSEKASNQLACDERLCVPVAVAIPEGFYLPLAIAAVHSLNRAIAFDDEGSSFHVVLVPLDPSDAPKRVQSMVIDARPLFILTAAPCDYDRLQNAIAQSDNETDISEAPSPLYRARNVMLLNIASILAGVSVPEKQAVAAIDQLLRKTSGSLMATIWECGRILNNISTNSTLLDDDVNIISHLCFTSGTTGAPKGCISSRDSLRNYLNAKNRYHEDDHTSRVLLASSISFDPCLSDILATFSNRATLVIARRESLVQNLISILQTMHVTHCLCTPTLWSTTLLAHDFTSEQLHERVSNLQCVALGGEAISAKLLRAWVKPKLKSDFCLCATYGVTEACVYQTFGAIDNDDCSTSVGAPFDGMGVRICDEANQDQLVDVKSWLPPENPVHGEVVLFGNQLDRHSSYLCRHDLSAKKFVCDGNVYYYRTGDRGFIHPETNNLHILGRIAGESGMVKINGIRIELSEIETAIVDQKDANCVAIDCMAVAEQLHGETTSASAVVCYVVLSAACLTQLGLDRALPDSGDICSSGPLLTLLRERCKNAVKIMPSSFIILPRIPLSPTGKRDRLGASKKIEWISLSSLILSEKNLVLLEKHGRLGQLLSDLIVDCLNLQPVQKSMLTIHATFGMAGGDSLAATRVTRTLYALHHNVPNSRYIGGEFGVLDGPFAARHLIAAKDLGSYVDWLESNDVCLGDAKRFDVLQGGAYGDKAGVLDKDQDVIARDEGEELYGALFESATQGYTNIGLALLDVGADPSLGAHGGRLGKVGSRLMRKQVFRSSPMHLACVRGDSLLILGLIEKGAAINSPDASGLFPLHLLASGEPGNYSKVDDLRRIDCAKALLDAGAPLSMKDGQKQTVIHVAARSGRREFLDHILKQWTEIYLEVDERKADSLDWRDSFNRTAVHWAVLNGHVETLSILLRMGCKPDPAKLKHAKSSSLTLETPEEMCCRLYEKEAAVGKQIFSLLKKYSL
ncbi:hypothetical protein MPSEU_000257100 [Mayamaea pseudoterrestris]|nr:hypothetical protein MPSEU_000257100 [Mayamaea pseudoterrestris]